VLSQLNLVEQRIDEARVMHPGTWAINLNFA
jgi:hypothetical protein